MTGAASDARSERTVPVREDSSTAPDDRGDDVTTAAVALVRALARPEPTRTHLTRAAALAVEADPEAVPTTAAALGVGPLVCAHVEHETFPPELRACAADYRRRMALRGLRLVATLHAVLDAFEAAGVRALAYKGPVLAARAYDDVTGRAFSDIDLFVPRADLPAAAEVLAGLGFAVDPDGTTRFSPDDVARGDHVVRPPAEFAFWRDDGVVVELRWRLGSRNRPLSLSFDECWTRRVEVVVGGRPVPAFAAEDVLVVLARHGAKHHWNRLGWAVDVAALLARVDVDWRVVDERARRLRARRVLGACLLLAASVADAPVPPLVLARARADPNVRRVVDDAMTAYDTDPLHAAMGTDGPRGRAVDRLLCDTRRERLLLRLRLGFEPQEIDERALPLPRRLHRLYHVLRPVRLARDALVGARESDDSRRSEAR